MAGQGQFLPTSLPTALEELASTPDAKAHNRYTLLIDAMSIAINSKRCARSTPISGRHGGCLGFGDGPEPAYRAAKKDMGGLHLKARHAAPAEIG
jgi:hypothetical protein